MSKVNGKAKGNRGEREAAKLLQSFGYEARRSQQYSGQSAESSDLLHNIPNVRIEVKLGYDDLQLWSKDVKDWMEKLERECIITQLVKDQTVILPLILWRKTRQQWTGLFNVNGMTVQTDDVQGSIKYLVNLANSTREKQE